MKLPTVKSQAPLEKVIQKQIMDYLQLKGHYVLRPNSGSFVTKTGFIKGTPAGTPDLVASVNGVFTGIEIKRPGKKPTPIQKATLKQISDSGGIGLWVTSLEELIKDLKSKGILL